MTTVDFNELLEYALRSQLTYAITKPGWYVTEKLGWRASSPYRIYIEEVPTVDVNAIVELNDAQQVQWIAVRGTNNLVNWLLDLDYVEKPFTQKFAEQSLTIDLHSGFYQATVAVWKAIQPHLNQEYQTRITGHSLGGAIAAILMMFCKDAGYFVEKCITFGQPKITNGNGAEKAAHLPLLRVINQEDVVPLCPPNTLLNLSKGGYVHFGPEVELEPNSYIYRFERSQRALSHSFWWRFIKENLKQVLEDIKDHYMQNYLHNLTSNLKSPEPKLESLLKTSYHAQTATSDLQLR